MYYLGYVAAGPDDPGLDQLPEAGWPCQPAGVGGSAVDKIHLSNIVCVTDSYDYSAIKYVYVCWYKMHSSLLQLHEEKKHTNHRLDIRKNWLYFSLYVF